MNFLWNNYNAHYSLFCDKFSVFEICLKIELVYYIIYRFNDQLEQSGWAIIRHKDISLGHNDKRCFILCLFTKLSLSTLYPKLTTFKCYQVQWRGNGLQFGSSDVSQCKATGHYHFHYLHMAQHCCSKINGHGLYVQKQMTRTILGQLSLRARKIWRLAAKLQSRCLAVKKAL